MKETRKRQIIQTLPFWLQSISQSRSKTVTDMEKVSQDFPICLAEGLSYSVLVIWYVEEEVQKRIEEGLVTPTLSATPGDLSLVLPKRILDGIVEMIYALDKVAPGTANDDTLLYGVEVKFYNMEVDIDENLESCHKGLYVIGDGSGVTHSLSHASASGVYVARHIIEEA